MRVQVYDDRLALSRAAAADAARTIRERIASDGTVRIVAATGMSQIGFLSELVAAPGIDWRRVEMFHLDEYVGLPSTHPASFRRYLRERFIEPAGLERYHLLDGEGDPAAVAAAAGAMIAARPVDIAFVGIGENGHLAFNDPPADFETESPFLVVTLDEACRRQQVGEGWFASLEEVPTHAISMSVKQILKARQILCIAPEARKARAVKAAVEGAVSPMVPASALQIHQDVTVYLDADSAALLADRPPASPGR